MFREDLRETNYSKIKTFGISLMRAWTLKIRPTNRSTPNRIFGDGHLPELRRQTDLCYIGFEKGVRSGKRQEALAG
jgi:hypothetical protein